MTLEQSLYELYLTWRVWLFVVWPPLPLLLIPSSSSPPLPFPSTAHLILVACFSGKSLDVRGLGSYLWDISVSCSLGGLWVWEAWVHNYGRFWWHVIWGGVFGCERLGFTPMEDFLPCSLGGLWMNERLGFAPMGDFCWHVVWEIFGYERLGFTPIGDFGGMFSGGYLDVRGLGSHLWEISAPCSLGVQ